MSEEEKTALEENPGENAPAEAEGGTPEETPEGETPEKGVEAEATAESADEDGGEENSSEETGNSEGDDPSAEDDQSDGEEAADAGSPDENAAGEDGATEVRQAQFQPITPGETIASGDNISLLLGVVVPVTIDLGGTSMPLSEVLALGPGSVVKLDRPLGEPVDIKVNGELVGRGEVVVVDDQFGVQVTELNKTASTKPREK